MAIINKDFVIFKKNVVLFELKKNIIILGNYILNSLNCKFE